MAGKLPTHLVTVLAITHASVVNGFSPLNNPCNETPWSSQLWCDPTSPLDHRVRDMISRMNVSEKIAALDTESPAIMSLGLNAYNWWSEATHGIGSSHVDVSSPTPEATNFAFPITTAMSFNRSLWAATGAAISREARAYMNAGHGYSTFWAPVINLAREPRWGRNLECPGEDPTLTGEYAAAFVQGFEHLPEEPRYLAASACCKHFVANSMEDSHTAGIHHTRYSADPNITSRDMVDSYLAPFQACVEKGHVSGLMCSYNSVNGVPSCANSWLLTDVAREAWGFDGYITSDCDAVANVLSPHHYVDTAEEAVSATLAAGMDIDCNSFVGAHGAKALELGLINETLIDSRLANLFRVRMRLGHFDPPSALAAIAPSALCTAATAATARAGVTQSVALLKNEGSTLPLDAAGLRSAAVIGPNANLSRAMTAYYGPGNACGAQFPNMVDAVASYLPNAEVSHANGISNVLSLDTSNVSAAAKLAAASDITLLVLGTDLTVAREGHDAESISIPAGQLALAEAVAAASATKVIVVMLTAVPLDLTPLLGNPNVGAILHAGQPSVQTLGVADVLFGATSPAGRMVQMIYPSSYQDEISPFDFNMRPGPSAWPRTDSPGPCPDPMLAPIVPSANCTLGTNPGRTYRFYNGTAVIPFGFGLSYTTFEYDVVSAPERFDLSRAATLSETAFFPKLAHAENAVEYVVNVTNTGERDADDVVLGFISPPGAGTDGRPLRTLFGFERIHVAAGATISVSLFPRLTDFTTVQENGKRLPLKGAYKVSFGVEESSALGMGYGSVGVEAA